MDTLTIPGEVYTNILQFFYSLKDLLTATSILGSQLTFPILFSRVIIMRKNIDILRAKNLFKVETRNYQLLISTHRKFIAILIDGFDEKNSKASFHQLSALKPYITCISCIINEPFGTTVTEFIDSLPNLKYAHSNFEVNNPNVEMLEQYQFKPEWLRGGDNIQRLSITGSIDYDQTRYSIFSSNKFPQLSYLDARRSPVNFADILPRLREIRISGVCKGLINLKNLRILDICDMGRVEDLSFDFPDTIPNTVETLHLSYSKIPVLWIDGLSALKKLVTLQCSFNELRLVSNSLQSANLYEVEYESLSIRSYSLESLYLRTIEVESLGSELENCKNLRLLELRDSKIQTLQLPVLESLKDLEIEGGEIGVMEGLNLPKLEIIRASGSKIESVADFNCPSLRRCFFDSIGLEAVSFLKKCNNVEVLDLGRNKIWDLSGIRLPCNLKKLCLSQNCIKRLEDLSNSIDLETLDLRKNEIADLSGMRFPDKLKWLDLSENPIKKLRNLNNLNSLSNLYISDCAELAEIEKLSKKIPLKIVNISNTRVNSLKPFEDLNKLDELEARRCSLSQIDRLNEMGELKILNLESNKITKIENLEPLCSLRCLNLNYNSVRNFENLKSLKCLKYLYLKHTKIEVLDGDEIRGLNNLIYLTVDNSQVKEVINFHNLPLMTLNLENNKITHVGGIHDMPLMRSLRLSENSICNIDEGFRNFPKLDRLYLNSNPLGSGFQLDVDAREIHSLVEVFHEFEKHLFHSDEELDSYNHDYDYLNSASMIKI